MSDRLVVRIDPPVAGWIGVSLRSDAAECTFQGSYAGGDPVGELVSALLYVLRHEGTRTVAWLLEPSTMDITLSRHGDDVSVGCGELAVRGPSRRP